MVFKNTIFRDDALKDCRILVTGASSGIGANAVKLFSDLGAHVILVGRNVQKLESLSAQLSSNSSLVNVVDLSVPEISITALYAWAPVKSGRETIILIFIKKNYLIFFLQLMLMGLYLILHIR